MQQVQSSEVSLDFSGITLADLENFRSVLKDDIDKVGKENIHMLCILNLALSEINSEINHKLLVRKLYAHKHHAD